MKRSTSNLIDKKIQKESCSTSIKEFLLKVFNEELLHPKKEHWNYKKAYEVFIKKYYKTSKNED